MNKKPREWPGNDLARLTDVDRVLHDHLCELLSDRMSENDVCTASMGIWGALSVMRDKLNLTVLELDAANTRIKDLNEVVERGHQLGKDFNDLAKQRDTLLQALKQAHGALKLANMDVILGSPAQKPVERAIVFLEEQVSELREGE